MKKQILLLISAFTITALCFAKAESTHATFKPKETLAIMEKVADWQLNSWQQNGYKYPKWDWVNAAGFIGIHALSTVSKNKAYEKLLIQTGNDCNWETGPRRLYGDDYCIGQIYALLYQKHKDPAMIANFRRQADSIVAMPHNESLEWKDGVRFREWAWCDALFMAPPSLCALATATGDKSYMDISNKLWWKTTAYLYDSNAHLYTRDGSYLERKEKNGQKVFWGRGNGWVMAGLVRVLENIPAGHPEREKYENLYKNMAATIASLQQADGSWYASLLDPASYPTKETSGTGFYCYALAWGLNNGLLNKEHYWPVVQKAWTTLTDAVHEDGMLGYVQKIAGSPNKVTKDDTEIYGVGAFLLAGTEIYKYSGGKVKK